MSYGCTISFKNIEAKDLFQFLQHFKDGCIKNMELIAKDEFVFSPIFRQHNAKLIEENGETYEKFKESTENWMKSSIFKFRWFYMADKNLLGVYGVNKSLQSLFDNTVYFQNSCDQDYEFDEWNGIPIFEEIAEKWKTATNEDIYKHFKYPNEQEEPIDYDYYRRSNAYDEIWKMFEETLYNDDKALYLSIFGYWDFKHVHKFYHMVVQETNNWIKEIYYKEEMQ